METRHCRSQMQFGLSLRGLKHSYGDDTEQCIGCNSLLVIMSFTYYTLLLAKTFDTIYEKW